MKKDPREPNLYKRANGIYGVSFYPPGQSRQRISTGTRDKAKAKARIPQIIRSYLGQDITLVELMDKYVHSCCSQHHSETGMMSKKSIYKHFGKFFIQGIMISEITTKDIQRFIESKGEISNNYFNSHVNKLHSMFQYAVDEEFLSENPVKIKRRKKSSRTRVATREEMSRILNVAEEISNNNNSVKFCGMEQIYCFILVKIITGMRNAEVMGMKWKNYRDGAMLIERKGGKKRYFPIPDALWKILLKKTRYNTENIFYSKAKKHQSAFKLPWSKVLKRAGIKENITLHDLRHTFATWTSRKYDMFTLKELMGHENIETTIFRELEGSHSCQHYCHSINRISLCRTFICRA